VAVIDDDAASVQFILHALDLIGVAASPVWIAQRGSG